MLIWLLSHGLALRILWGLPDGCEGLASYYLPSRPPPVPPSDTRVTHVPKEKLSALTPTTQVDTRHVPN